MIVAYFEAPLVRYLDSDHLILFKFILRVGDDKFLRQFFVEQLHQTIGAFSVDEKQVFINLFFPIPQVFNYFRVPRQLPDLGFSNFARK